MQPPTLPIGIHPGESKAGLGQWSARTEDQYATSLDHLLAELGGVHLLVAAQVKRARQLHKADEQFQGLVIAEEEVDELLTRSSGLPRFGLALEPPDWSDVLATLDRTRAEIASCKSRSIQRGIRLRLAELERLFSLTRFEIDCLLICLAPELDSRYQRLYAYLQDDVTRKRPSVDLVLNLLCPSFRDKLAQRRCFMPGAPLLDGRLVFVTEDPAQGPTTLLGKYLNVDERIIGYLLGSDDPDSHLIPHVRCITPEARLEDLVLSAETKKRFSLLARRSHEDRTILYFQGPYGSGRKTAAEVLCRDSELGLLVVDTESLASSQSMNFETAVRLAGREALLQGDALYWDGFEFLLADEKKGLRKVLLAELRRCQNVAFLAGTTAWEPAEELQGPTFVRVEFPCSTYADRVHLWQAALPGDIASEVDLSALANKFRFSGGQIRDAARSAWSSACWRDPEANQLTTAELYEACRLHSSRKLSSLGRKIKPHHTWKDIVLPEDRLQQLREICNSMKYRSLVFDQWGFDRKLSLGKGLNILFAGPSGTGKTMAADIMAGELGLDLYKIDLSTVVSKYIGETEKNLARIFAEAEASNAILFFDEADALFGKRSEVRDSHDRYANIEVNYLLQKMEEHEGVVILATNFRKNMDDAFVRRMHFTVEFAFPNESDRRRIWEQIWPKETPQSPDLDLDFMARRFEMPGGNIRNIATAAAFLAASDGGVVNMTHLLHGTRREYQKMGKVVRQGEFQ
ncbi:MAG TPA: ATP-binding protein [Terriglobales bacterium]